MPRGMLSFYAMKKTLNPGQLVRSTYRKGWKGVVVSISCWSSYKGKEYPIYLVRPIVDTKNNPQPKHVKPRRLSSGWLIPIPSIHYSIDYRSWPTVQYYE